MARVDSGTAIASNTWTELLGSADGSPRQVKVANLASSGNPIEVFVVPLHGNDAPAGGNEGFPIAVGASEVFTGMSPSGGVIRGVYARSNGATVAHAITIL